jgi:hypothetical protein
MNNPLVCCVLAAAVGLLSASPLPAATPLASDPKALAVADEVMAALGGMDAWRATRYLRFDFAVEREGKTLVSRAHTWDKWTGRYRLEGKDKEGRSFVSVLNLNSKAGSSWREGKRLTGEEEKKQLENAHATWVNDTYWLLMPYKLADQGVRLGYAGTETGDGAEWDKLLLSFDNVGLTPKDRYWVWVNKKTRLVDRWDYILDGGPGPATTFLWKGWRAYGAIQLAPERVDPKKGTRIFFPVLEAPASLPDAAFAPPAGP